MSEEEDKPEARRRGTRRPTHLTPEVFEDVRRALEKGAFRKAAALWAGISYTTFREWLLYGKERPDSEYGEFHRMVVQVEMEVEVEVGDVFLRAAKTDAKFARDWLRLRYRKRWQPPRELEVSGKGGQPLLTPLADALGRLSEAQLEAFARLHPPAEEVPLESPPEGEDASD